MTTSEVQPYDLAAFAATLSGSVIRPDDDEYAAARRVWNGSIDRYPSLIVRPRTPEDVALTIALARQHRLPLAVRGGGHNVAGSGTCDTGVVLDLVEMNDVVVDSDLSTIRAGGGCTWAQVDAAAGAFGLATPGGLISSTGVAGLTLGGGIGWLSRKHGYTSDNLLEVELVTADGAIEHVSADRHPDLFWALRGGGGNFGVVTAFTFRGHPVSTVLGGPMLFRADRAAAVLDAYAAWAPTVPDEMTTMVAFVTAPPAPFVPDDLQGLPALAVAALPCGRPGRGTGGRRPAAARPARRTPTPTGPFRTRSSSSCRTRARRTGSAATGSPATSPISRRRFATSCPKPRQPPRRRSRRSTSSSSAAPCPAGPRARWGTATRRTS